MQHREFALIIAVNSVLWLVGCQSDSQVLEIKESFRLEPRALYDSTSQLQLNARAPFNMLCFLPGADQLISEHSPFAFRTAKGQSFAPMVTLIGKSGDRDEFKDISVLAKSPGNLWLCYNAPVGKLNSPYVGFRVVSPESLSVGAVSWHSSEK